MRYLEGTREMVRQEQGFAAILYPKPSEDLEKEEKRAETWSLLP